MNTNVESFKPKLRAGRVIPQGSRIVFETTDPYNQIVLPMVLADMILLCSGQFSVREIVEKIYHRQGSVPFKPMLTAIHALHQGGFFENGDELELSPELKSWMDVRRPLQSYSRRISARISLEKRRPQIFYLLTLTSLILSMFGLAHLPLAFGATVQEWMSSQTLAQSLAEFLIVSSALQSLRFTIRTLQLLTLTSKAFNLTLRVGLWGVHFHVGDEANELIDNRLFAAMFYVSQILAGWLFVFVGDFILPFKLQTTVVLVASAITFIELNPFWNGSGRKLIRALLWHTGRDVTTAHFGAQSLAMAMNPNARKLDRDFARLCAVTGAIWIGFTMALLYGTAVDFGPMILTRLATDPSGWPAAAMAMICWLAGVYYVAQALVESVFVTIVRPYWRTVFAKIAALLPAPRREWSSDDVVQLIEELPLFSHFPENFLEKIALNSQVMTVPAGAAVIHEGAMASEIYVLFEGTVKILRVEGNSTQYLGELGPVSVFGEAALVDNSPRAAQVVAATRATVLRVPIAVLRKVAQEAQSVRKLEVFRNAILVNQFFASSPVFRSLSTTSIDFLCSRGTLEYFDQDQVVFAQGDRGDSLYLILRGIVRVEVHDTEIRRLEQGAFFGEIAMIANLPRTATIRTLTPGVFFKIDADAFWEVLVQHMDLGVFIESVSETRLKEDLQISEAKASGDSK